MALERVLIQSGFEQLMSERGGAAACEAAHFGQRTYLEHFDDASFAQTLQNIVNEYAPVVVTRFLPQLDAVLLALLHEGYSHNNSSSNSSNSSSSSNGNNNNNRIVKLASSALIHTPVGATNFLEHISRSVDDVTARRLAYDVGDVVAKTSQQSALAFPLTGGLLRTTSIARVGVPPILQSVFSKVGVFLC